MTLVIMVANVKYLPVRAVPFVTGGVLTPSEIARMIVEYESYCDDEHDAVVSPFKLHTNGHLVPVERSSFGPLMTDQNADLPPGVIVQLQPVRELYDIVVRDTWARYPDRAKPAASWDEDPALAPSERAFVQEGMPSGRVNSEPKTRGDIGRALRRIDADLQAFGLHLDFDKMPGKKADWTYILGHYVPRVRELGVDSMGGYYKRLGYRWYPGSQVSIDQVKAALKLP